MERVILTDMIIDTIESLITPTNGTKKDSKGRYENWSPNAVMRIIVGIDGVAVTFYTGFTCTDSLVKTIEEDGICTWKFKGNTVMIFKPYIFSKYIIKQVFQLKPSLVKSAISKFSYPNLIEIVFMGDNEIITDNFLENEAQTLKEVYFDRKIGYVSYLAYNQNMVDLLDRFSYELANPLQCVNNMSTTYITINPSWQNKKYTTRTTTFLMDKRENSLGSVLSVLNRRLWTE